MTSSLQTWESLFFFFLFISLEFLPGNKTATHPGHMTLYLHYLFMYVSRVEQDNTQTPFHGAFIWLNTLCPFYEYESFAFWCFSL